MILQESGLMEKIILPAITAFLASLVTWIFTRPKQKAEIVGLQAETDKIYQNLAIEMQEKLPVWIERYENENEEKMELQGLLRFAEREMHRLSKDLKACNDNNAECRKVIEEARNVFSQFETALSEIAEHAPLLNELKEFRRRLEKI